MQWLDVARSKGSVRWADEIEERLVPPPQMKVSWRATERAPQLLPSRSFAFRKRKPTMRYRTRPDLVAQRIQRVIPVAPTLLITSPTRPSIARQRRHSNSAKVEPIVAPQHIPSGVLKGAKLGSRNGNALIIAVGRQRTTLPRVDGIDATPILMPRARVALRGPEPSGARAGPDAKRAGTEHDRRGDDERGVAHSRRVAIWLSGRAVQFSPPSAALRASSAAAERRGALARREQQLTAGRPVTVGAASRSVSRRAARIAEREQQERLARDAEEEKKFLYSVARVSEWRVPPSPGASTERGQLMPWAPTPSSLNWDDGGQRSLLSRSRSRANSRGASRASSRASSRGGGPLSGRPSHSRASPRAFVNNL